MPNMIDPNLSVEIVFQGLNMPTTMAFLGTDDFLILQKMVAWLEWLMEYYQLKHD